MVLFFNNDLGVLVNTTEDMKTGPIFYKHTKKTSVWIVDLNMTVNMFKENMSKN